MLQQDVRLNLHNKGSGFTPGVPKWTGHGLAHMVAPGQKIGGRFTLLSKMNEGTGILLDLPNEASYACP